MSADGTTRGGTANLLDLPARRFVCEQLVMWKVLANLEWYYRSGHFADGGLWLFRKLALYPDYPPSSKKPAQ